MKHPDAALARFQSIYTAPFDGSRAQIEFLDGRVVERNSQPLYVDGVDTGRVHSFRDITEHLRDTRMQAALHGISEAAHHASELPSCSGASTRSSASCCRRRISSSRSTTPASTSSASPTSSTSSTRPRNRARSTRARCAAR
jgi:hypothetical protein